MEIERGGLTHEAWPDDETADLVRRLEGVAQILTAVGRDGEGSVSRSALLLLGSITEEIAKGLRDRLRPESTP